MRVSPIALAKALTPAAQRAVDRLMKDPKGFTIRIFGLSVCRWPPIGHLLASVPRYRTFSRRARWRS
jgi:hypothetical protein